VFQGCFATRVEMVIQAQNSFLGSLDVFICEESSPKFKIYYIQQLMVL